jgi:hypothetical protein
LFVGYVSWLLLVAGCRFSVAGAGISVLVVCFDDRRKAVAIGGRRALNLLNCGPCLDRATGGEGTFTLRKGIGLPATQLQGYDSRARIIRVREHYIYFARDYAPNSE